MGETMQSLVQVSPTLWICMADKAGTFLTFNIRKLSIGVIPILSQIAILLKLTHPPFWTSLHTFKKCMTANTIINVGNYKNKLETPLDNGAGYSAFERVRSDQLGSHGMLSLTSSDRMSDHSRVKSGRLEASCRVNTILGQSESSQNLVQVESTLVESKLGSGRVESLVLFWLGARGYFILLI